MLLFEILNSKRPPHSVCELLNLSQVPFFANVMRSVCNFGAPCSVFSFLGCTMLLGGQSYNNRPQNEISGPNYPKPRKKSMPMLMPQSVLMVSACVQPGRMPDQTATFFKVMRGKNTHCACSPNFTCYSSFNTSFTLPRPLGCSGHAMFGLGSQSDISLVCGNATLPQHWKNT